MLLIICSILATVAASPHTGSALVFGTKLEDITVRPTEPSATYLDKDGDVCQCVPYYFCDTNMNAKYIEDPSLSGFGLLDVRYGTGCQESIERCCKIPKINTEVKPLKPNASRLKGCGYRNVNGLDFTILGGNGNEAQFGEFPWVVAILDAQNDTYHGVGVLIHPQVVMTGAHIVQKLDGSFIKIRAGEWDTQTDKERLPSQERLVVEIKIRSDFKLFTLYNDIALLRLEKPVELADHINVACLPEQDESFDGSTNCIANGWGREVFGLKNRYAVILKKVEINMVPNPVCNMKLSRARLGRFFKLHESFVCAGGEDGQDTCTGDGGAPLVCPVGDNRYKLSGLVAWGIGCGKMDVPAVYTRVAMFRGWVDDMMTSWGFDTSGYKM